VGDICFEIFFDSGFKPIRDSYVTPIHNHTMLELHALHKGCVLLETDNTSYIMNPGDMILIGKQVYHHIPSTYGDTLKFTLKFSYSYSPGGFLEENEKQLFRYFDAHVRNPDYTEIFQKCTDVERIFNDLFSLTEKNPLLKIEHQDALLKLLMIELLHLSIGEKVPDIPYPVSNNKLHQKNLQIKIIEYFFNYHYVEDVSCMDLAQLLYFSEKQTNRLLQSMYGMSFQEKLRDIRLRNAKMLLRDNSLSVAQIAKMVGYSSNGLCNVFKKIYGISPNDYRKSLHMEKEL